MKVLPKPLNRIKLRNVCSFLEDSGRNQRLKKFRIKGGFPQNSDVFSIYKNKW